MSGIAAIRKRIEEAFAAALEQGPPNPQPAQHCDLKTKQSLYTEEDSRQFHRHADAFITAAVHSPHVKLHRHRANSYYVGDINEQPRVEDLFAEAVKHYAGNAQKGNE